MNYKLSNLVWHKHLFPALVLSSSRITEAQNEHILSNLPVSSVVLYKISHSEPLLLLSVFPSFNSNNNCSEQLADV
jgi:hypothetical protein